jgi:hypothetical protein
MRLEVRARQMDRTNVESVLDQNSDLVISDGLST